MPMSWINKILIFISLYCFLFASKSVNNLIIDRLESNQTTLSFNLSNNYSKQNLDTHTYNYILELESNIEFEYEYLVDSTYQIKANQKNYFQRGVAKNEISVINPPIVSVVNQFLLN